MDNLFVFTLILPRAVRDISGETEDIDVSAESLCLLSSVAGVKDGIIFVSLRGLQRSVEWEGGGGSKLSSLCPRGGLFPGEGKLFWELNSWRGGPTCSLFSGEMLGGRCLR